MVKSIFLAARPEVEKLLNRRVHLMLRVRVAKKRTKSQMEDSQMDGMLADHRVHGISSLSGDVNADFGMEFQAEVGNEGEDGDGDHEDVVEDQEEILHDEVEDRHRA